MDIRNSSKSVAGNNSYCFEFMGGEGVVLGTCEGDIEKSGAERHFPDFGGTNLINF